MKRQFRRASHTFILPFSDLIACTNEPNVSIPQLANLLIERTQSQHWVVVFKALVTIHNLMNYGNEVSLNDSLRSTIENTK
jgi:hypothetical protein